ncbi:MAG: hypothetical protein ACK5ZR_14895 [Gemmatimonadaceae bacterium]
MTAARGHVADPPMALPASINAATVALKAEGSRMSTEIERRAVFRDTRWCDVCPSVAPEACGPRVAWVTVYADPAIRRLQPRRVTVGMVDDATAHMRLVDPRSMLASAPRGFLPRRTDVAPETHARIRRVTGAVCVLVGTTHRPTT